MIKRIRRIFGNNPVLRNLFHYFIKLKFLCLVFQLRFNIRKIYGECPKSVQLNSPLYITTPKNVFLEEYVRLQNNVSIINSATGILRIKKYSAISAGTTIITGNHIPTVGIPHFFSYKSYNDADTTLCIEEDVWVGAETRILAKGNIGRGAIIATGSVVTKKVLPYAVMAGTPAKLIAVKFSVEQIIAHEKRLYSKEDRFSLSYLTDLFHQYYNQLPILGENAFSDSELDAIWDEISAL